MSAGNAFRCLALAEEDSSGAASVSFTVDGRSLQAPAGCSVAAALLAAGVGAFRTTGIGGEPRAAYCMMGVCFDCLVEIDGVPNCQACLTLVRPGMRVRTQRGLPSLAAGKEAA
jgi:predicted molibdopterin-dependent oxidoreductase YjgC